MGEEGIRGLYKGFVVSVLRDVPSYAVYFGAYEYFKFLISGNHSENSFGVKILAGGLAGVASWGCIYPIDIIKTRI